MAESTIANLTLDEFRKLVRETVRDTIRKMVRDPDEGLDLQESMKISMQRSLAALQGGAATTPADEVAARLGVEW